MNFILIFTVILINGFGELRILPILPVDHSHNNSAVENDSKFKEKDFSYLLGNVNGIHDDLLKMHFTLYRGYVKNSNLLSEMLENLRKDGKDKSPVFGALKRRFGWEYDGMFLHELYFKNLGKPVSLNPKSDLYQKIVQDFGSFEKWLNDFKSTGLIRGIGWVILYQDPIEGSLFNVWIDEHNINHLSGGTPILVMDVWEHAYISQFGLDRAKYIDAFCKNINWKCVESRFRPGNLKKTSD